MSRGPTLFVFGNFEADERRFELRCRGVVVPLRRRTLEVVFFFLRNRGSILTKRDLVQGPGGGVAVGDSAMHRAVMLARRALADDGSESLIVTVRGKGYRFDGEVRELIAGRAELAPDAECNSQLEPSTSSRSEPLLGRSAQLRLLREQLESARSGLGVLVVLSGPAGIGKTALVESFAREAQALGTQVAHGRAWEGGAAPALLPWAELARALAAGTGELADGDWPPGFSDLLARLVPDLAPSPCDSQQIVEAQARDQGEHARFRLFDALARFLVQRAKPGPLLLVIEDLHAADEASVLMLQFLRRSMREARLMVVVTLREGEGEGRACIRELLASGQQAVAHLSLPGLEASEVECLLERIQGTRPEADIVETVCRLTEGNPLWISELVQAGWLDSLRPTDANPAWQALPVPDRAMGWIAERLRGLGEEATRAVHAASVMGREFSWPFVLEMQGLAAEDSVAALRQALEAKLFQAVPERAGEFRFPHALVRDAVYSSVPADVRFHLHARAVAILTTTHSHDESRRIARLAHHAAAAIPLCGPAPAIEHGLAAASHARQLCSYELAVWHGRQALDFLDLAPLNDTTLRWQAWLAVAESESLAGRSAQAMASFEALMTASLAAGQHETFARAILSCFEHVKEIAVTSPLFHGRVREALGLCHDAIALRARLMAVHAVLAFFYAPAKLRIQQTEEAVRLAREVGDPHTLLSVLRNGHFAALTPVAPAQARVRVEEMSSLAERLREPIARLEAHFWSAQHALDMGQGERFHSEVHAHARLAAAIRHPVHLWYAALLASVQALLAGEIDDSIERARTAVVLGIAAAGAATAESYGGGQLLALAWLQEGTRRQALFADVTAMGRRLLSLAPGFCAWRLATLVARCETEGASSILSEYQAAAAAFGEVPEDAYWLLCAALLVRLASDFHDTGLLETLEHRLSAFEGLQVSVTSLYLGPVNYHLGQVAESLAQPAKARVRYQRAAAEAQQCQAVLWCRAAEAALERLSDPNASAASAAAQVEGCPVSKLG